MAVKAKSVELLSKIQNLNERIVVFYDEASQYAGLLVNIIKEKQAQLVKYVEETYSNVQVFVTENWMRLDFNKDGSVTLDDVRRNLQEFYTFLKNYDYIEATISIKSTVYDRACALIKKENRAAEGDAAIEVELAENGK